MNRLILALLLFIAAPVAASAAVCPSVPNTFVNGTVADANAMNANFQTLVNCFNNDVANSGINTNITKMSALTSPPSGAGSLVFSGGVAGGTANALTLTSPNPAGFALTQFNRVWFLPSLANTGATTLAANGTAATAIEKLSGTSLIALVGGELNPTVIADAIFDGTEYVLLDPAVVSFGAPQPTVYTTGSGTYTTPTGATWLEIKMVGGGSGGGGGGTGGGNSAAATATTFGSLTAGGGAAGLGGGATAFPSPATASGASVPISGGLGSVGVNFNASSIAGYDAGGGFGAASMYGAGTPGGILTGTTTITPSNATVPGSGGGGGPGNSTNPSGWGGNSGAGLKTILTTPSATYSYAVGAGTAGGAAGTGGTGGSAGAGGVIEIIAH